ncbi:MAG: HIT domain-containing protein [Candidatus Stygibacter australis]|nr:HIT domain-containing protein [Candidatus Stygibacter australis]MDP8321887.1 HIT domain-containing protein [Candidatus Stygibacter australis]
MTDILYSPWRMDYINSQKEEGCIFCLEHPEAEDEMHLILYRSDYSFVIMNLYPYNNGHLMVVPRRHTSNLLSLEESERNDLFELVQKTTGIIHKYYHPDGLNIGMNIGKAAGAGIDEHIHVHIVPRWTGDVNFMTSASGVRVIPEKFENAYQRLKEQFDKLND